MQRTLKHCLAVCLLGLSGGPRAAEPFAIDGLSVAVPFDAAVARFRSLGGQCRIRAPRGDADDLRAECDFPDCDIPGNPGGCGAPQSTTPGEPPVIEHLRWAGIQAPVGEPGLTRLVLVFADRPDAVESRLEQRFGPARAELNDGAQRGWTRTHRRSWARGRFVMGLSDYERMITLTVNPSRVSAPAQRP